MKNIVLFLLFYSIQVSGQSGDYVIIKGNFQHTTEEVFKVSVYDYSYLKLVKIDKDGNFDDTLHIPKEGFYSLTLDKAYTSVYLRKRDSVFVSANGENFNESITVGGKGASINLVIRNRTSLQKSIIGDTKDFFVVPLDEFLGKLKTLKDTLQEFLNYSNLNERDKGIQQLIVDNYCLLIYNNYKKFYNYHKKVDPVLPDNYFKPVREMNMDNDTAFQYSSDYRLLIIENWRYIESDFLKLDSSKSLIDFTANYIKGIKSEVIKDQIVRMLFKKVTANNKNLESDFQKIMSLVTISKSKDDLIKRYNTAKSSSSGSPIIDFAFENEKGQLVHLSDFKGKYVYIEVWATWCGPCIREMPALKSLISTFKDDKIEFVSISVDDKKDVKKWLKTISEKAVGGVQLISDNRLDATFMKILGVSLLPRSILIGPDGKIVVAAFSRPSNPETTAYLQNVLKSNVSLTK